MRNSLKEQEIQWPGGFSFREIYGTVKTKDSHARKISKP